MIKSEKIHDDDKIEDGTKVHWEEEKDEKGQRRKMKGRCGLLVHGTGETKHPGH